MCATLHCRETASKISKKVKVKSFKLNYDTNVCFCKTVIKHTRSFKEIHQFLQKMLVKDFFNYLGMAILCDWAFYIGRRSLLNHFCEVSLKWIKQLWRFVLSWVWGEGMGYRGREYSNHLVRWSGIFWLLW